MHELYIAESIIGSVKKSLPAMVAPEAVTRVRVEVGRLDAIVPESLEFMFDAVKASQGLPWAKLCIATIDVKCRCNSCNLEFCIDLPVFICPDCGSGDVEVIRGRGTFIMGITIADGEDAVCRTPALNELS